MGQQEDGTLPGAHAGSQQQVTGERMVVAHGHAALPACAAWAETAIAHSCLVCLQHR